MSKTLAEALSDFDRDFVMETVKNRLDCGEDPMRIVVELQQGMSLVGDRFSEGNYFLSELMMSADLFTQAMKQVEPRLGDEPEETWGEIVIGTPKGDIHDLGKNIFCTVAKGAGFGVHDLGVDVPAERFLDAVEETKPQILGFSALITTAFEPMKRVVDALEERGVRQNIKVIIGGGVTTETVRNYVGADGQTTDALEGLNMCKRFVGV